MLRIKYELDKRGLKQVDLAAKTKLKPQAVSRIVNGQEPPWPNRGKRIADALGWEGDPAELFEPIEIEVP
ncbi:Helix-turn-helix [Slackia heliotrinireducens]|uniref:Helix-turn-helix protein n=1 Tax=Slackia heliotrinireducens (strain ATCC 29202 / DSM 20476 / NCTC 11029 / RHS 1) TaxID=471855 RepID=C7N4Q0_SLAHD|nr:helix-turn-helix transcriptional regulator [Slackia heliotrinireducens]ACV21885.1 Helix-turn-helix protein [Slackia heliotrinireducens DSM 20476]VEG99669.1 Helix-turn-helix [Slackia heliotrinireducens]